MMRPEVEVADVFRAVGEQFWDEAMGHLSAEQRRGIETLQVAIDLNAVPPAGPGGGEVMDKGKERDGVVCYGAIGVGGTKMKIHKAALGRLFEANDLVLETEAVYRIGEGLGKG